MAINSDLYEYNQRVRFEQRVKLMKLMNDNQTAPQLSVGGQLAFDEYGKPVIDWDAVTAMTGTPLISYTDIRMHQNLSTSTTTLTFDWSKAAASKTSQDEHLLENAEFFMPLAWAFHLQKYPVDAAAAVTGANFPLFTYPDKLYFPAAGTPTAASEADALEKIYQGRFAVKSNGQEYHKDILAHHSRYVPERGHNDLGNEQYPGWGADQQEEGYVQFFSDWVFEGTDNVQTILDLAPGDFVNIAGDDPLLGNRVVAQVRGLIVHNWINGSDARACQL